MELLCSQIPDFIDKMREKYPKYSDFPRTMQEVQKKYRSSRKVMLLSPHWFIPVDPDEYTEIIKNDLNWKQLPHSYPANSTNCDLNLLGSYFSMKEFGFTHFHIEMSKLIREGNLSREEAMKALKMDIDNGVDAEIVDRILNILNCSRDDIK